MNPGDVEAAVELLRVRDGPVLQPLVTGPPTIIQRFFVVSLLLFVNNTIQHITIQSRITPNLSSSPAGAAAPGFQLSAHLPSADAAVPFQRSSGEG